MQVPREQQAIRWVAGALLLTVATQVFYVGVVANAGADTLLRPLTWFTELAAFSAIAIFGHGLAARQPASAVLWSAIAFSGLLNALQVVIGLSMFKPAMAAGEGQEQLFATVLAGAFFLYFLAKAVLGVVAIVLGVAAWRTGGAMWRTLAGLAALGGMAALILNFMAMIDSKTWMFAAGATGTVATALVGVMMLMRSASRG